MTEIEARVADLINFSSNQKPLEFTATFKEIMQDRIAAAIENKKIEVAQAMFNPAVEDEAEEADETEVETDNEDTEEVEDQEDAEES